MTTFTKTMFRTDGDYLMYGFVGMRDGVFVRDEQFVARFKYGKNDRANFKSFLAKNFTTEEYFGRLAAGESPLGILQDKGYMSVNAKRACKLAGYPVTTEGYRAMIAAQVAATLARVAAEKATA